VNLGLSITGGAQLAANLNALGAAVRQRALVKVLRAAAWPIQSRAIELAPIDPRMTYHLKDHIVIYTVPTTEMWWKWEWTLTGSDEYQAAVAIGPSKDAFWGGFLEFGTVKMAAKPFMRPAFDYGADRALSLIREGLWALLEEQIAAGGTRAASTGEGML
jgi:HK97 gp10 family phage protein